MKYFVILNIFVAIGLAFIQPALSVDYPNPSIDCNVDSAYERGFNSGVEGHKMDSSFALDCEDKVQPDLRASYKKGYLKGVDKKPKMDAKKKAVVVSKPGPQLSIQIGSTSTSSSSKEWFCEVSAFTKTYTSFGSTQFEARATAKALCEQEYHAMHCDSVKCTQNR